MSTTSQFHTIKSLAYLMIGLAGATMAGSGQYMHEMSLKNAKNNCIASGTKKSSCETKYASPYSLMNTILMYGGCGFIVLGFCIVWLLGSSMFGARGMGMGMGMQYGGMYGGI